ncbi:hypothetical protein EVG20_g3792 [Dentipellis fragilis]|uniref:Fucose-specific lectin n=1 Tax=Dentipellis fragilis TaxID=205917 RepID=A0A4Y9Z1N5_9AGAM|nr:hypothetical protein EVG20_g3792 [Dentipellis fragilis]
MATVTGSTIAVVSNRPGVTIFYRVGDVIQIYRKTVDGQSSYDQEQSLSTHFLKGSDSNITATKRSAGADDRQARVFYQGSDRFLRELTIASDGNAKDRAISTVKDARAKTSLAAIVQKDLDRPSSQSAKMPDVLFYQGIDNQIYFVKSDRPSCWSDPMPIDNVAGQEGTTIQAFLGSALSAPKSDYMSIVYVCFLRPGSNYIYRYSATVDDMCNSDSPFSAVTPDLYFDGKSSKGRFGAICVPRIYCRCKKDFRFYSQFADTGGVISEGIGQDGIAAVQSLNEGKFEQEARDYAQMAAVYQRTDKGHYAITVVFEDAPRSICSVTLEGSWNPAVIVGDESAMQFREGKWEVIHVTDQEQEQLRSHGYTEEWNGPVRLCAEDNI